MGNIIYQTFSIKILLYCLVFLSSFSLQASEELTVPSPSSNHNDFVFLETTAFLHQKRALTLYKKPLYKHSSNYTASGYYIDYGRYTITVGTSFIDSSAEGKVIYVSLYFSDENKTIPRIDT